MTIKKRLFLLPALFIGLAIGLFSCLDGDNYAEYDTVAVIKYSSDIGELGISTNIGIMAAPSIADKVEEDDCVFISFRLDYDNQPSKKYFTATNVTYSPVTKNPLVTKLGDINDSEYNEAIKNLYVLHNPNYYGKLFVYSHHIGAPGQEYNLELVYNPDSVRNDNGNIFYLKAQKSNEINSEALTDIYMLNAFDIRPFMLQHGRDTLITVGDENYVYRIINVDLKYQTGSTSEEVPVYSSYSTWGSSPEVISSFK